MCMRNTIQSNVVVAKLARLGHATNKQLWEAVTAELPDLSLTSVHRISCRLRETGDIGCFVGLNQEHILDSRADRHSHFMCNNCGEVRDIEVEDEVTKSIQSQLDGGLIESGLMISGKCKRCWLEARAVI